MNRNKTSPKGRVSLYFRKLHLYLCLCMYINIIRTLFFFLYRAALCCVVQRGVPLLFSTMQLFYSPVLTSVLIFFFIFFVLGFPSMCICVFFSACVNLLCAALYCVGVTFPMFPVNATYLLSCVHTCF